MYLYEKIANSETLRKKAAAVVSTFEWDPRRAEAINNLLSILRGKHTLTGFEILTLLLIQKIYTDELGDGPEKSKVRNYVIKIIHKKMGAVLDIPEDSDLDKALGDIVAHNWRKLLRAEADFSILGVTGLYSAAQRVKRLKANCFNPN